MGNQRDNLTIWDGFSRGHYEVYYLKFNLIERQQAFWIRYTLLSPMPGAGEPVAELWAIAFDKQRPERNLAWKQTFPAAQAEIARGHFSLAIAGNEINHQGCRGLLHGGGGNDIQWRLDFLDDGRPGFRHFPLAAMYRLRLPKTKVQAPHLFMEVSGEVRAWGETIKFERAPGHQAHIWGTKHAQRWAWANAGAFAGEPGAVFEALSAQIKAGPFTLPHLTLLALRCAGREWVFNRPLQLLRNYSRYDLDCWDLAAEQGGYRLEAKITNRPLDMAGVIYRDPDGETRVCHNTKVADLTLSLFRCQGDARQLEKKLTAIPGTVAFEVVQPVADPRVKVLI